MEYRLGWLENIDGLGQFENVEVIASDETRSVVLADLDHDNDQDILLSSSKRNSPISWLENEQGIFAEPQNVDGHTGQVRLVSDMDKDGLLDFFIHERDQLFWYEESAAGALQLEEQRGFEPRILEGYGRMTSFDVDADGDQEIIFANLVGPDGFQRIEWSHPTSDKRHLIAGGDPGRPASCRVTLMATVSTTCST